MFRTSNPEKVEEPVIEDERTKAANERRREAKQLFEEAKKFNRRPDAIGFILGAIDHLLAIPEEDKIDEDYYLLHDYYYEVKWPYNDMGNAAKSDEMQQLCTTYPSRSTSDIAYSRCDSAMYKIKNNYWFFEDDIKKLRESASDLLDNLNKAHTDNDCRALVRCFKTLGDIAAYASNPENADKPSVKDNFELSYLAGNQGYYYLRASQQMALINRPTELDISLHHECAEKANLPQRVVMLPQRKHTLAEVSSDNVVTSSPQKKQKLNSSSALFSPSNPTNVPSDDDSNDVFREIMRLDNFGQHLEAFKKAVGIEESSDSLAVDSDDEEKQRKFR